MIRRPTRIYGVSNTSQKFRDGFLAVSALLSLSSSQAQMNGRPQRDYAYILAQMKVQFVRLFLKPPVVVLAHLDNSVAFWRCGLWPFVPWPFVLWPFVCTPSVHVRVYCVEMAKEGASVGGPFWCPYSSVHTGWYQSPNQISWTSHGSISTELLLTHVQLDGRKGIYQAVPYTASFAPHPLQGVAT